MAENSSSLSEASKLVGPENYAVWKFRMKTLLQKEDLWELVSAEPQEAVQAAPPADREGDSEEDGDVRAVHKALGAI